MNSKLSSIGLLFALVSIAGTSQAFASTSIYRFTDLGTLGGSESSANAINEAGLIAGWARTASGEIHATVWNAAGVTDLGTLGGTYSIANDINDLGQVVGAASTIGGTTYATLWNGSKADLLGTSNNVAESSANAINNSGQAVGWTQVLGTTINHSRATSWDGAKTTYLGEPEGFQGSADDINDSGQVVGRDSLVATLWNGTKATQLGSGFTSASAINSSGQVAGSFTVFDFLFGEIIYGAITWNGSDPMHPGMTLDGLQSASAINDIGQIVGVGNTFLHATLWNDGTVIDLNSFLDQPLVNDGWELAQATDINDNGWIVGNAFDTQSNTTHAFLLTPVPEADSYAMFIAGLGLLGFVAYRRRLQIPSCA